MSNKVIKEEEIDNKDFNEHLLEAQQADLHDLERSGCVKLGKDNNNENIIIFIPRLGFKTNNEKSELMLKLMLLLFVRSVNEIVNDNYSIVYGHTNMDILNHYPLIYKFYAILPRKYKKNLQKMYIIHTNYTIRMFFEFARVFLSNKFYSKLVLLDNILDFQKIIPPTILLLPMRFLKREDDEKNIKYYGNFASLIDSFDPSIGTTRVMFVCITFIKHNNGLKREGIFRIPGDDVALSLARTRLQYAYNYSLLSNSNSNNNSASMERIDITKKKNAILIGDVELISNKPSRVQSMIIPKKEHRKSFSYNQQQKLSAKDTSAILSEDTPTSIVLISDIDTVAQILKVSIRDLPEPLIPFDTYEEMMQLTRSCERGNLNEEWETKLCEYLAFMPHEHLSTLHYLIRFLREVASECAINNMDSSNLAIIFSPTMFRPRQEFTDPFLALQEVKLSQIIIKELIEREYILDQTAKILAGGKFVSQLAAHRESGNSYSNSNRNSLNRNSINRNSNGKLKLGVPPPLPPPRVKLDARKDLTAEALQKLEAVELQELAESFSPQMMARMVNGRTKSLKNHKESVATDEEETNHEDEHEIFKDVSSDD